MKRSEPARYVPKAWGHEEILIATPNYTLKRLTVLPGFQCSLHYHVHKCESFLIESGVMLLETQSVDRLHNGLMGEPEHDIFQPGASVYLRNFTAHRFKCGSDAPCVFWEVSTYDDPADTVRLEPSGPIG